MGPGVTPTTEAMETDKQVDGTSAAPPAPNKKYYIDSTYLYTPRENVEMLSPLKDGLSEFKVQLNWVGLTGWVGGEGTAKKCSKQGLCVFLQIINQIFVLHMLAEAGSFELIEAVTVRNQTLPH